MLDGELVCLDPDTGRPVFDRLMCRVRHRLPGLAAREAPATFMAFGVLEVDGTDVCSRPWAERRILLEELYALGGCPTWRVNTAFSDGAYSRPPRRWASKG